MNDRTDAVYFPRDHSLLVLASTALCASVLAALAIAGSLLTL